MVGGGGKWHLMFCLVAHPSFPKSGLGFESGPQERFREDTRKKCKPVSGQADFRRTVGLLLTFEMEEY